MQPGAHFKGFSCDLQAYAEKGVRDMYPWQAAALECAEDGSNLVYCAPTSGGKSLVAEVLMLRKLLATRRPGNSSKRGRTPVNILHLRYRTCMMTWPSTSQGRLQHNHPLAEAVA